MDQRNLRAGSRDVANWQAGTGAVFRFASRYLDVLVVPWVLEAPVLLSYLCARAASLLIPFVLGLIGRKTAPRLSALCAVPSRSEFQAAAARVNLGYLMVCGAIALLVLYQAPLAAQRLGLNAVVFEETLIWLVVGQSAPILFGATCLLMHAAGRAAFHDLLLGLTAAMFLIGISLQPQMDARMIAQTLAAAQLTQGALCAALLTQCGVWPGLTALLHKQIKLF